MRPDSFANADDGGGGIGETGDNDGGGKSDSSCPICGEKTVGKFRPFCSGRCADVDLGRWMTGAYAIPAGPDDDEDGESQNREPLHFSFEDPEDGHQS